MNADTRTLAVQFNYTAWVFRKNLEGLSNDDALRGPEPGGNSANWVAGHIAHARAAILDLVGAKAPFSPKDDENETVGSLLAGLAFHEAYHTGQLGILRRVSGADGAVK